MARRVAPALFATALAGGSYQYYTDEGTRRSLRFWTSMMPVYSSYRLAQLFNADDSTFDKLHDRHSPTVQKVVLDLGGFYIKLAQTLSTQDEVLPPQYKEWVKQLQNANPVTIPYEDVVDILRREYGSQEALDAIFKELEPVPFAAASIGQVHRARLRKNNQQVAVKIKYPTAERYFRADIQTIKDFCAFAMPQHVPAMDEIERQFVTEFDYVREGNNLELIRKNVAKHFSTRQVVIPRAYLDLCRRDVLVMEYIPGKKLDVALKEYLTYVAGKQNTTAEKLMDEMKAKIESGEMKAESMSHNAWRMTMTRWFIKTMDGVTNIGIGIYNVTFGLIFGFKSFQHTPLPLNMGSILHLLFKVHAYQVFYDGALNGDPHPGNILYMPDGRLALVDYGQVKHLPFQSRVNYARLMACFHDKNTEKIITMGKEVGFTSKNNDPEVIYKLAAFWNDRATDDITGGKHINVFLEEMEKKDPIGDVPADFVLVGRCNVLLRGMANAFNIKVRTSEVWGPVAKAWLTSVGETY